MCNDPDDEFARLNADWQRNMRKWVKDDAREWLSINDLQELINEKMLDATKKLLDDEPTTD